MAGQQTGGQGGFGVGLVIGLAVGAGAMFVLDPLGGRRRRALVRDQMTHLGTILNEFVNASLPKQMDYLSGVARGARHQMSSGGQEPLPDETQFITDRVRSIVFRDPDIPKGGINVNTVDQVVYLHGHVDEPAMAAEIERRVRAVEGVRDVVNVINRPDVDPSTVRNQQIREEEERA